MTTGSRLLALAAGAALACGAEPASTAEVQQTIAELVDLGRAMALEQRAVALSSPPDPAATPEALATRLFTDLSASTPCASLSRLGATGLQLDFGAGACEPAEPRLSGALRIVFSAPSPGLRVATLTHVDLMQASARLNGTTQLNWGPEQTLRVISELRLDTPSMRQIEIQADRVQRMHGGELRLDGWHRWQTLMGHWAMQLGGWVLRPGALLPIDGIASVDTPFEHDVQLQFVGELPQGLGLRANGGRLDRLFAIDPLGEVVDLGED